MSLQTASSYSESNVYPTMDDLILEHGLDVINPVTQYPKTKDYSDLAQEMFLKAVRYTENGKWEKAIEAFRNLVKLDPAAEIYFSLGAAYYLQGDLHRAAKNIEKSVRIDPNNFYFQRSLGIVYMALGKIAKALKPLRKAIRLNPNDGSNYIHLAHIQSKLRHWQLAIEACQKAIALNKNETVAYYILAVAYKELGVINKPQRKRFFTAALEVHKQLLKINPKDVQALKALGVTYHWLGELEEAEKAFEKVLKLDPDNADALNNLRLVKEDQLEQRLFELGFLKRINEPITDFTPYKKRVPIKVKGKPISETIIEERR